MLTAEEKFEKMKQIRDEVLEFTASPLYEYRKAHNYFPVIGQGNHSAKLMFVGEAPGENEAKTAIPFCGAAGRILNLLFDSINLVREDVYITNIVKDRPPENRDPTPAEIELYAPFLDRQIDIIQPEVLITLGRFSMQYLMKRYGLESQLEPISKMHGRVFETAGSLLETKIRILPLYHPAMALYNPNLKQTLIDDIQIVKQFL
jgi:uracil-DNA glycosylase family 4